MYAVRGVRGVGGREGVEEEGRSGLMGVDCVMSRLPEEIFWFRGGW